MQVKSDVLVIGGGLAGVRASIEASDRGANVVLVSKKKQGFCGASFYPNSLPWGVLTAGEGEDAVETYFNEIIGASCGAINEKLVEVLARESNARFEELCQYGVKFTALAEKNRVPCFGTRSRGAQLNSIDQMRKCITNQLLKRDIKVVDNVTILDLVVKDHKCFGAIGIDHKGEGITFQSKTVVLATGGAEALWKHNLVTPDILGDGYAMALRSGVKLANMEFIQFIPATVNTTQPLNFHCSSLKSMPNILNIKGEGFLHKYLPSDVSIEECLTARATHGPFSNEDASRYFDIALSVESEVSGKCGAHIVYSDEYYEDGAFTLWKNMLSSRGIDTKKINLEIYPHCQGFNGGIVIDETCCTGIENLFACGECTGGPHGANRMGGNAILDTQVFGKIAGENAASLALRENDEWINMDVYSSIIKRHFDTGNTSELEVDDIIPAIKGIMDANAMIIRDGEKLGDAIDKIKKMRRSYNPYQFMNKGSNVQKSVLASNALLVAQAILHAMAHREESRGAHYRVDFPTQNDSHNEMYDIAMSNLSAV